LLNVIGVKGGTGAGAAEVDGEYAHEFIPNR